jgi:hypothetical protein
MRMRPAGLLAVLAASLLATACTSSSTISGGPVIPDEQGDAGGPVDAADNPMPHGPGSPNDPQQSDRFSPVKVLMRYDANHDGSLSRAELEAGLRAEFAAADTNHNGVLDLDEIRAVNDKRWQQDNAAASPLVDWNGDGVVDYDEYAATARSLFVQIDLNNNGILSPEELNPQPKSKKGSKPHPPVQQGGPSGSGGPG